MTDQKEYSTRTNTGAFDVTAGVRRIGDDLLVWISGGVRPHIGAAAMAHPRPSLKDPRRIGATASVFTYSGHREDAPAKQMAERLSAALNRKVVVTAGMHWDGIDRDGIRQVLKNCEILTEMIIAAFENAPPPAPASAIRHPMNSEPDEMPKAASGSCTKKRKRIIVAVTGASGVIYGIEALRALKKSGAETHLILSDAARRNIRIETSLKAADVTALADFVYDNENIAAPPASGSFLTDGMMVTPCTVKTLSGIANSYTGNLIVRAADVCLKERRKLVLMIRETPFHRGHLRLMIRASEMGAVILPPVPAFYHQPETITDIVHQSVGKLLDFFEIEHRLFRRWGSAGEQDTERR